MAFEVAVVKPPRVLLVTGPSHADAHLESVVARVGAALPRGAFGVIVRDKQRSRAAVVALVERLRALTSLSGAKLIVHSDTSLALAVAADGVHLGGEALGRGGRGLADVRRALPDAWISVAAHDDGDVRAAATGGADAVLVSPIYETGKSTPRGTLALTSARAIAPGLAVYALGGVDAQRASACRRAGADGVAIVRALLAAPDPVAVARAIDAALVAKID